MSRAMNPPPSQQKLAEKLDILNDRGVGMLTRIYNIKKVTVTKSCLICDSHCDQVTNSISSCSLGPNTSNSKLITLLKFCETQ